MGLVLVHCCSRLKTCGKEKQSHTCLQEVSGDPACEETLPARGLQGPCLKGDPAWSNRRTQSTIPHRLPSRRPALGRGGHCGLVCSKHKILLIPTLFLLC